MRKIFALRNNEEDADMSITYLTEKAKELGLDCSFTKEYKG